MNLSWSISTDFPGEGGNVDDPDWLAVSEKLHAVLRSVGSVRLENEDADERTRSLSVIAEKGAYFLTFGVETAEDWVVRTYKNPMVEAPGQMIDILGNHWNTQAVCTEGQLVLDVFKEFFHTGDVVKENLA